MERICLACVRPSPFPMPWALSHRANRVGTLTVADPSRLPLCPPVSVSRTCRLSSLAYLGANCGGRALYERSPRPPPLCVRQQVLRRFFRRRRPAEVT
eukprot:scaffold11684_cov122-Isochrysis_galbana.AAC.3